MPIRLSNREKMVALFKNMRSRWKLRAHGKNLRRLVVTRDDRNVELARRLAAGQGITIKHFEKWAKDTVQQYERRLEMDNVQPIAEHDAVLLPTEDGQLLFFHGVRPELVREWWGEYWRPQIVGCVKFREDGYVAGMRVPFIDPFPTDSKLLERRNQVLTSMGYKVYPVHEQIK